MSNECQHCGAKSQLALCNRCTSELRDTLTNLAHRTAVNIATGEQRQAAGWLELLEDARFGATRLGESARRSTETSTPLVVRLGSAQNPDRNTQWQGSPLDTLRTFHGTLATWIRHLCESRGATFQPINSVPATFTGPLRSGWRRLARDYRASITDCAEWLAHHSAAIACDEAAGELYRDVHDAVDTIERIINRPPPPKYCGPCPTIDENEDSCDVGLYATWNPDNKSYDTDVTCWKCHITHNADQLISDALGTADGWLLTAAEVLDTMAQIGEPISERTWRHWRKTGAIQSRNQLGAEPKYFIGEVRYLRQTFAKTGRAS